MANPTFLAIVNKVLGRLRENTVASVSSSAYATMIGEFVNMVKTDIEAAWTWRALRTTISVTTAADSTTTSYTLTGSGNQFKAISVWNTTNKYAMVQKSQAEMDRLQAMVPATQVPQAQIRYFCYRGVDTNGDTKIDIYPAPTAAQVIQFNLYIPQADLSADTDTLTIPSKPVIESAWALAVAERGEDGGVPSQVQDARAKQILADAIYDDQSLVGDDEKQFSAEAPQGMGTWDTD